MDPKTLRTPLEQVIIFTDELATQGGWHGEQLKLAFAARGVSSTFASLRDCLLDFSGLKPVIRIPQCEGVPQAAFVRGIAGGSMQQVTTRLNVLHLLKRLGTFVYNDAHAIERTVDKAMTSFLLLQAGISTPPTWVCESRQHAHQTIRQHLKSHAQIVITVSYTHLDVYKRQFLISKKTGNYMLFNTKPFSMLCEPLFTRLPEHIFSLGEF